MTRGAPPPPAGIGRGGMPSLRATAAVTAAALLGLGLPSTRVFAADPAATLSPLTRTFSPDDYEGEDQNWDLSVSRDGLIYVANTTHLLEFDGTRWRRVQIGGVVWTCRPDGKGRIWVGSNHRIVAFGVDEFGRLQQGAVITKTSDGRALDGAFSQGVAAADDTMVFATRDLVVAIDVAGTVRIVHEGEKSWIMPWQGKVLARTASGRVGFISTAGWIPVPEPAAAALIAATHAVDLPGGVTLAFSERRGQRFRGLTAEGPAFDVPLRVEGDAVRSATALGGGRVAIGTTRSGILILGADGGVVRELTYEDGLRRGTVNALACDPQGGLWLAHDHGLSRVETSPAFGVLAPRSGLVDGVHTVRFFEGRFYAGTTRGVWMQTADRNFTLRADLPSSVFALTVLEDSLLIGGSGIAQFFGDRRPTVLARSTLAPSITFGAPIPGPGAHWFVAPDTSGLAYYRREGGGWTREENVIPSAIGCSTAAIAPDGWIWMESQRSRIARVRWNAESGPISPVEYLDESNGVLQLQLAEPAVIRFAVWQGETWIGCRGGLFRWNAGANRFQSVKEIWRGLPDFAVGSLQVCTDGALWMLTDPAAVGMPPGAQQLFRFLPPRASGENGEWSEANIRPVVGRGFKGICPDVLDEHLLLNGSNGVVGLRIDDASPPSPLPIAQIRSARADGRPVTIRNGTPFDTSRMLAPGERNLNLEYSAPWYPAYVGGGSPLHYRTHLDGFEKDWSPWSKAGSREFTNLPPGRYTFEVQAGGWEGDSAGAPSRWSFEVPAPWWYSFWAAAGGAAVAAAGLIGATRAFTAAALRRRVARLEARSALDAERVRIARDMHDDIGSALSRVILLCEQGRRESPEQLRDKVLPQIRVTARELSASARDIIWSVNPRNDSLPALLDYLADYVSSTLQVADIVCQITLPPDPPERVVDAPHRHALLLALKEAVNNLVRHANATQAEFTAAVSSDRFAITLTDNGQGPKAGKHRGSGLGLESMQLRLERVGGSARFESSPGIGMKVTLELPLAAPEK